MRTSLVIVAVLVALAGAGWQAYRQFAAVPLMVQMADEPEELTYLCTETGRVTQGEWQPTPAVNPSTGRATVVQALFCEQCHRWYPAPPVAMGERSPRGPTCPRDQSLLVLDGPLPADGQQAAASK